MAGESIQQILEARNQAVRRLSDKVAFGRTKISVLDTAIADIESEVGALGAKNVPVSKKTLAPLATLRKERDGMIAKVELIDLEAGAIMGAAAAAVFNSQEVQNALKAIEDITRRLDQVAARMLTVAQYIGNAKALADTGAEIKDVLAKKP